MFVGSEGLRFGIVFGIGYDQLVFLVGGIVGRSSTEIILIGDDEFSSRGRFGGGSRSGSFGIVIVGPTSFVIVVGIAISIILVFNVFVFVNSFLVFVLFLVRTVFGPRLNGIQPRMTFLLAVASLEDALFLVFVSRIVALPSVAPTASPLPNLHLPLVHAGRVAIILHHGHAALPPVSVTVFRTGAARGRGRRGLVILGRGGIHGRSTGRGGDQGPLSMGGKVGGAVAVVGRRRGAFRRRQFARPGAWGGNDVIGHFGRSGDAGADSRGVGAGGFPGGGSGEIGIRSIVGMGGGGGRGGLGFAARRGGSRGSSIPVGRLARSTGFRGDDARARGRRRGGGCLLGLFGFRRRRGGRGRQRRGTGGLFGSG
mmetsp:Transcript_22106/g.42621  ORF Transcript_22106/g.42621 Transcript_22106/m.42621 type:complete len:369 (+) Transcript_22106:1276-2382(+)